jgi:lipopolysaccharide export system ATP-binding protein
MLRAEGLRKRFKAREVVRDFSFALGPGEVVGLLGPNGAGKTTCFYLVVGMIGADRGRILLDERDITRHAHARARETRRGLPAAGALGVPAAHRGRERPRDPRAPHRPRRRRAPRRAPAPARRAPGRAPEPAARREPVRGERRRVEIARALAGKPRFMLLDEPFAGVDPISVHEIQRIVAQLKARGIGVLITDHNVRETLGICDRAYIMNEGAVLAEGEPSALLENPKVREVYLGHSFRM